MVNLNSETDVTMSESDGELINKFNRLLDSFTVENVDIIDRITEKCKLSEEFSMNVLQKTQFITFCENNLKEKADKMNEYSKIWEILSILTKNGIYFSI